MPDTKEQILYIPLTRGPYSKFTETGSGAEVSGVGKMGRDSPMGTEFLFGVMKRIWKERVVMLV